VCGGGGEWGNREGREVVTIGKLEIKNRNYEFRINRWNSLSKIMTIN
jgi:hypothetical protein